MTVLLGEETRSPGKPSKKLNVKNEFVRYDSAYEFPMNTMSMLEKVHKKIGVFEYRRLKDGGWCIRTIPTMQRELPLAAIGNSLHSAGKRMLVIVRLME